MQDFDVTLTATMIKPDSLTVDQLGEQWANVSANVGSLNGALNKTDTLQVKFQNPKKGGLYKFDFNVDTNSFCPRTTAQVLLPLAGTDIVDWLANEIVQIPDWGRQHRRDTIRDNLSLNFVKTAQDVWDVWTDLSAGGFDYEMDPVDSSEAAPCRRYQPNIGPNGHFGFITVNGVVVHGSKINNMLWAIFGRGWGFPTWALRAGAHLNELGKRKRVDPQSSQNAIVLGGRIYDQLESNPNFDVKTALKPVEMLTLRQGDENNEERGLTIRDRWPAERADFSKSTLRAPVLSTTPMQ